MIPAKVMQDLASPNLQLKEQAIHFVIENMHQYARQPSSEHTFN